MKNEIFRQKFENFLGDKARFKKFVSHLNKVDCKRLLYWQELAINKFAEENNLSIPAFNELKEIFMVCEVHGVELQAGSVQVSHGNIDYSPAFNEACIEFFPNSFLDPINGPIEKRGQDIDILYCSKCRESQKEWDKQNV